jgi:hypothetical protein
MKYLNHTACLTLAMVAGMIAAPVSAQSLPSDNAADDDESVRISVGANYSSGDYGEIEKTKVLSAPVSIKYTNSNFSFRVSVPYVRIEGPGTLLDTPDGGDSGSGGGRGRGRGRGGSGSSGSGDVDVEDGGAVPLSGKRSGIGDVVMAATYSLDLGSDFFFDATGRVKLPTASSSKRIGTGKADVTVSGDLGKDIGPASLYVHGRRRFAGSTTLTPLRDTWGAGGGASINTGEGLVIGADYDWQQSPITGNPASSEVTGWASFRLAKGLNLSLFGSTGLNNNSTDFAGGMTISVLFD